MNLQFLAEMFTAHIGIDLGTKNCRAFVRGIGVVLNEPSGYLTIQEPHRCLTIQEPHYLTIHEIIRSRCSRCKSVTKKEEGRER